MKHILIVAIAIFAASCGTARSSTFVDGSAGLTTRKPQADSQRFTVAQLLTLVAMDVDDNFDDANRGREMVILGPVEKADGAMFHFYGGERKEIGCMRGKGESFEKLVAIFEAKPTSKPIVEAIVKYNAGNHDPRIGETYVSTEDCAILSINE